MDQAPTDVAASKHSLLANPLLAIAIAPIAVAFLIAASLSAGPREVYKALTDKD